MHQIPARDLLIGEKKQPVSVTPSNHKFKSRWRNWILNVFLTSLTFLIFRFSHLLGVPPGPDLVDFGSIFGWFGSRFEWISAPTSNREPATTKHITKAKPQKSTTAIHPSFHAHNLSRSSASGTWLAEGLVGSREAIRIIYLYTHTTLPIKKFVFFLVWDSMLNKTYHNSNENISICNDSIWKIHRLFARVFVKKIYFFLPYSTYWFS